MPREVTIKPGAFASRVFEAGEAFEDEEDEEDLLNLDSSLAVEFRREEQLLPLSRSCATESGEKPSCGSRKFF